MGKRLEVADVWLESDWENQTLLKPLKWYIALKQIMTGELPMVETSPTIQGKSSDVVLSQAQCYMATDWQCLDSKNPFDLTRSGFIAQSEIMYLNLATGEILFLLLVQLDS